MLKRLIKSYVAGITDSVNGERYSTIIRYFAPEFTTAFLLYFLPFFLDEFFICCSSQSTSVYATLGGSNNLLHFIIKIGEGLSVGTIILCGQFNGKGDYKRVGRTLRDSFWSSIIIGGIIACCLYIFAGSIYRWYGAPEEMVSLGVPFLRLRAVGIFLTFLFFSFIGFLRGIKNTFIPMSAFILGAATFILFDYLLIFGKFGFPAMGLQGSALAPVIQYVVMLIAVVSYVLWKEEYRKYAIDLFSFFNHDSQWKRLIFISLPVTLDKATMAAAYIWLAAMLTQSLGMCGSATFNIIKSMERCAILPAMAFAQVITFLVSNDLGRRNWIGIKSNIKKVVFLSSIMVGSILFVSFIFSRFIVHLFDSNGDFEGLAVGVFPVLAVLGFFDLLQLVLSGALRGAANVKVVMITRLVVCFGWFVPASFFFSRLPIQNVMLKFCLVYGSFYVGNALMSIVYIYRFCGQRWKQQYLESIGEE